MVPSTPNANCAGRPLAQRLLVAGEQVVDVPTKLAARVRLFDTGHNRKTGAMDAHSIAVVAARTVGLRLVVEDGELEALRMLSDCRDELAHQRIQTVNRLQRPLRCATTPKAAPTTDASSPPARSRWKPCAA